MKILPLALGLSLSVLVGCASTTISKNNKERRLISEEERSSIDNPRPVRAAPYVRTYQTDSGETVEAIRVNGIQLRALLEYALPRYNFVAKDGMVDLQQSIRFVSSRTSVPVFLTSLEAVTGYEYEVSGSDIFVKAVTSKSWVMPTFADKTTRRASVAGSSSDNSGGGGGGGGNGGGGGGGGGGGNGGGGGAGGQQGIEAGFTNDVDEWDSIVANCQRLLVGAGQSSSIPTVGTFDSTGTVAGSQQNRQASFTSASNSQIIPNRVTGTIQAFGPVSSIKAIDQYLQPIMVRARKQIRLDIRTLEVTLNNSKARGIDWDTAMNTIFADALGVGGIALGASLPVSGSANDGTFTAGLNIQRADDSFGALVTFLQSFGSVELRNEPQATTLNGHTAYIGSGQESGYVASVQQTVSNGTSLATPTLQRILIGVQVAITPRVLDDDKILLEVVPIISTLNGFDNFTFNGSSFSQPRIVLNQLATKVITSSGKSIQLGGLITTRIQEATKSLPFADGVIQALSPLVESKQNAVERRELIMVVTPYLSQA